MNSLAAMMGEAREWAKRGALAQQGGNLDHAHESYSMATMKLAANTSPAPMVSTGGWSSADGTRDHVSVHVCFSRH